MPKLCCALATIIANKCCTCDKYENRATYFIFVECNISSNKSNLVCLLGDTLPFPSRAQLLWLKNTIMCIPPFFFTHDLTFLFTTLDCRDCSILCPINNLALKKCIFFLQVHSLGIITCMLEKPVNPNPPLHTNLVMYFTF